MVGGAGGDSLVSVSFRLLVRDIHPYFYPARLWLFVQARVPYELGLFRLLAPG